MTKHVHSHKPSEVAARRAKALEMLARKPPATFQQIASELGLKHRSAARKLALGLKGKNKKKKRTAAERRHLDKIRFCMKKLRDTVVIPNGVTIETLQIDTSKIKNVVICGTVRSIDAGDGTLESLTCGVGASVGVPRAVA